MASVPDHELLLACVLGRDRGFLRAHPEYRLSIFEHLKFFWYARQRRQGWSVANIIHHKEFFGLDFYVNRHTLIPRPETELLVEQVLEHIAELPASQEFILIDIGTGSGCIPISITKKSPRKSERNFAVDCSRGALRVAKKNAATHNAPIVFLHGDLLEPLNGLLRKAAANEHQTFFITANLPYLTAKEFAEEPSIQREPRTALVADNEGLALYEELLQQLSGMGLSKNQAVQVFFEINPHQTKSLFNLIKKYFPKAEPCAQKDLAERERVVIFQTPS